MTRIPDTLFSAEYIKNILYFATVRQGKVLKDTIDTHYFCIDNELVYENYYSDFGPLNLGCVYKYCKKLNDKLKLFLNKQTIVHYTSLDPKKKTNAAYLLGCYGVLYLSLTPKDALKPLLVHGQSYRHFQDATQGDSTYTISLLDCLQGIRKAHDLGLFSFQDFNYDEYDRLDKIQGGDLNWIVPGKFLAFIGPVNYSVSLYHPPEMYIDYFLENNVKIVVRLNKRLYDGNVFNNVGIIHYDLFFPDGSCPPRHILFKFLQISEDATGAIAVHCKGWLEQLEPWLQKQGNLYRKRLYQDTEKIPNHDFGIYSIAEKTLKQRPILFHKSPSPPPPMQRQAKPEIKQPVRPQASKTREEKELEDEEVYIAECDLTVKSVMPMTQMKGCIIKSNSIFEDDEINEYMSENKKESVWQKYLCCKPCIGTCNDFLWILAVRYAKFYPNKFNASRLCSFLDMAAPSKATNKVPSDWHVKLTRYSAQKIPNKGDQNETRDNLSRRSSAAGDPRLARPKSRSSTARSKPPTSSSISKDLSMSNYGHYHTPIFRTSQAPIMKNVSDAKDFLVRSSVYSNERERQLKASLRVVPQHSIHIPNNLIHNPGDTTRINSTAVNNASRGPINQQRRRLGRSPSPSPIRGTCEKTRATNTATVAEKFLVKDVSKCAIREALSRLKLAIPRDGSIGAASLGARRDAPLPKRAPSVRSDERPLATQGDMLNSIKFQRRLRHTLYPEKLNVLQDKNSSTPDKPSSIRNTISKTITPNKVTGHSQDMGSTREKSPIPKALFNSSRPLSPKGRRISHNTNFY